MGVEILHFPLIPFCLYDLEKLFNLLSSHLPSVLGLLKATRGIGHAALPPEGQVTLGKTVTASLG